MKHVCYLMTVFVVCRATVFGVCCATVVEAQSARDLLSAAGIKGGLVVHIDCGDGKLTATLHADDKYLVHGLDTDARPSGRGA